MISLKIEIFIEFQEINRSLCRDTEERRKKSLDLYYFEEIKNKQFLLREVFIKRIISLKK
jgi:hypothetical protein